jgi:hypothetical protein
LPFAAPVGQDSWKWSISASVSSRDLIRKRTPSGELATQVSALAPGEHLGAFGLADVEIGQDLLQLVVGGLGADHRLGSSGLPCLTALVRSMASGTNWS